MLIAGGNQLHHPKPARRQPLQQINSPANGSKTTPPPPAVNVKPNLKLGWIEINDSNKENNHPTTPSSNAAAPAAKAKIESFDSSLAEELSAIREKMERLRLDKEKTDKMLRERDLKLEMQMDELDKRGEMQKTLEIEVDRLYRLKELQSSCMRISPIRSLREKEQEKIKEDKPQEIQRSNDKEEIDESTLQSPTSETDTEK